MRQVPLKIFCYQRHINDWRRKTSKLSLEQRGVYSELIDWYYCTGGDLPNDLSALCRMVGAITRSERETVKSIITNTDLFTLDGCRLVQKMCDETLSFIAQNRQDKSKAANARWKKNKDLHDAHALQEQFKCNANHKPITNNHNIEPPLSPLEQKAKPHAKRERKSATFISEEFRGDIKSITLAGSLGVDFEREQRQFIDHYLAKGESRADWQASFRTWISRSAQYRAEREQRASHGRQGPRDVTGAVARVIAIREQANN